MKRFTKALFLVALSTIAGCAGGETDDAEELSNKEEPTATTEDALRPAPTCVQYAPDGAQGRFFYAKAINRCKTPVRIKFVIAFADDSACQQVPPNGKAYHAWIRWGRFDGLKNC